MKLRVVIAVVLIGAGFLTVSGAHASEPVLDGKRVKVIKSGGDGGTQNHEDDPGRPSSGPDVCMRRNCSTVPFVYQPAADIPGGLKVTLTWSNPDQDLDIYLVHVNKYAVWSEVAACVGPGSTAEEIYVAPSALKHGGRYVMVVDFVRSGFNTVFTSMAQIKAPAEPGTKGCLSTARPPAPLQRTSPPAALQNTSAPAQVQGTTPTAQVQGSSMPFWRSMALLLGGLLTGAGLVLASVRLLGRRPDGPVQLPAGQS